MKRISFYGIIFAISLLLSSCSSPQETVRTEKGTLRISKVNPRYFTDNSDKAIYLTGSHTWNSIVDMLPKDSLQALDFNQLVAWTKNYNHNFIRLWTWELLNWDTTGNKDKNADNYLLSPNLWLRTGPGKALDGKLKFDLNTVNSEYINRLIERIEILDENEIYASVMLFEGWGIQFSPNSFENHPFHPKNNINGINGDTDGDGKGIEIHTLADNKILEIQKMYVKKVIEALNDFDNIIYEIGNEINPVSTDWQYAMIKYVKELEQKMGKQHAVGMTYQHKDGTNQTLFESPADWVSPNKEGGFRNDPPVMDSIIVLPDTDHLWGIGGNHQWVWKSFMRGQNPIFMDSYECKVLTISFDTAWAEPLRKSMGYTRQLAEKIDLIHMPPKPNLASTKYCLANEGVEYLVYLPNTTGVSINLKGNTKTFTTEWINPESMKSIVGEKVKGGEIINITSPFKNKEALVYMKEE